MAAKQWFALVSGLLFLTLASTGCGNLLNRPLAATDVRDLLASSEVPCDSAEVIDQRDALLYRCEVAGQDFTVALERSDTSLLKALADAVGFRCIGKSDGPLNFAAGVNWVAFTRSNLVSSQDLAAALGGKYVVVDAKFCEEMFQTIDSQPGIYGNPTAWSTYFPSL
jgi:hypothetical protein